MPIGPADAMMTTAATSPSPAVRTAGIPKWSATSASTPATNTTRPASTPPATRRAAARAATAAASPIPTTNRKPTQDVDAVTIESGVDPDGARVERVTAKP